MSAADDRRRIEKVLASLDRIGLSGLEAHEAAELSMRGIVVPQVLGEAAEKRADQAFRNHAATGQKLEFHHVKAIAMGMWAEGFMAGYKFAMNKEGGESI